MPLPALKDKFILVKNSYSVISSGTEKTKIDMGKNLIDKARQADLVKQVLKKFKNDGLTKTFNTVKLLESPSSLVTVVQERLLLLVV